MKVWVWISSKLYKLFEDHRDQVVVAFANIVRINLAFAAAHIASLAFLKNAPSWAIESGAAIIVNVIGIGWGAWLRHRIHEEGIAATRLAVARATNAAVSTVPDSVHNEALAQVRMLDKSGGVPAPKVK